ncbi:hypothetical protein H4R23_004867 [Coemansia sp. Cherry 401B]|nr:hypothetical protein H4R23_004867 [Coemansia sp. Cherry 401B]
MIELTDKELALGKRLADVDKSVRDRAAASIKLVLSQDEEFAYMEMLRHWKALFYCFWLSDKPLVQQELAWDLASLILACKGRNSSSFVRAFWETLCREWFDVDKHRVDKYLLLARRMVFFTFKSMQQSNWDGQLVDEYMSVYQEIAVNSSDPKIPNSIRTHVGDVYVDELVRLASEVLSASGEPQAEVAAIPVARLLEPFMRFISTTPIRHLPAIIQESVFENIVVRIAEAEERDMAQDSDGDMEMAGGDVRDNQIENESLQKVQFLADSIPNIKKRLLAVGSEDECRSGGRKRLHLIYQALCDTFPDDADIVIAEPITIKKPIGAEERKAADKHKRKQANKKREQKERKKQKSTLGRSVISTSGPDFDMNALASETTAEDRRKYEADVAKAREIEKRVELEIGEDGSTKPTSKKAQRKEKKQAKKAIQQDDIPQLVPIGGSAPESSSGPEAGASVMVDSSAWIESSKRSGTNGAHAAQRGRPAAAPSLLDEIEKTIVVKDKMQIEAKAPAAGQGKGDKPASKKRLGWALERNSTKRFLKKVPMMPSTEPAASMVAAGQLKSALRKESAYGDGPEVMQPPVKLVQTKKKRRAGANGRMI